MPAEQGSGIASAAAWSMDAAPLPIDTGLAALGLNLSDRQKEQLTDYLGLLRRWNRVYNLTAVRDRDEMISHHLLDCLAVVPPLAAWAATAAAAARSAAEPGNTATAIAGGSEEGAGSAAAFRILDVGSGGGLPGVVLAVCRPDWAVTCVDTVAKKASFIRQVAAELRLPKLRAEHARVERLADDPAQRFDLITARAFSSLVDFTALTRPLLAEGGVWMAMKGIVPDDEIRQLPEDVEVFHVEQLAVPGLDAQRCLVWMRPRATGC